MAQNDEIDLNGWHTAYAMRYEDINADIAKALVGNSAYPTSLSLAGGNITATTAPFGLALGGKGKSIRLSLKLTDLSVTFRGTTFDGGSVTVTIRGDLAKSSGGSVSIAKPTGSDSPFEFEFVMDDAVNDNGDLVSFAPLTKTYAQTELANWLDTLWDLFGAELTSVDNSPGSMDDKNAVAASPADWSWLRPTLSDAIVQEAVGGSLGDAYLIIVNMTGTKPRAPTSILVTGDLIPQNARIGFAIAPELVLENLIKPGVSGLINSAKPDDFTTKGKSIVSNKTYVEPQFDAGNGDIVKATFKGASVHLAGQSIVVEMPIAFPFGSAGTDTVDVSMLFKADMRLKLNRQDVPMTDGSTTKDVPLIGTDNLYIGVEKPVVTAKVGLAVASWLVPLGSALLSAVIGGVAAAKPENPAPSEEGNPVAAGGGANDIPISQLGQNAPEEDAASSSESAGQAIDNVEDNPGPRQLKRQGWSLAKGLRSGILSFVVGGVIGSIPVWIRIGEGDAAADLATTLDDALLKALQPFDLPSGLKAELKITSIGLNNALLLGGNVKAAGNGS